MYDIFHELGTITSVWSGIEDHGILTSSIGIDFDGGGHQGFGGLALNKKLLKCFEQDLCNTFNVSNFVELEGKKCYALRCFDTCNEPIEGLESLNTGLIFTITTWQKKHLKGKKTLNPLDKRIEHIRRDIEHSCEQIREDSLRLKTIKDKYKDWT